MWELHMLLNYKEANKQYLMDIILDIMNGISQQEFVTSLKTMYKNPKINNGLTSATMFMDGLKKNNFLYFEDFINSIVKR